MIALRDRVAIVTGASRGIGRAIALGLARHGCHVVIAAKSTTSREDLPGSIFSVAEEVEKFGVVGLPVAVDIRFEDQIDAMVRQTESRFGRIDFLINNAGALFWRPLIETPAKRFDLVMGVNVRGAFLCCRAVLPIMIRQRFGHIINMSPPMEPRLAIGKIAYAISKLGMTLLTFGLAEEVRAENIAVNSLWPATMIESQATIHWQLGRPEFWRKPDILVDCVIKLLTKSPGEMTGRALIDEDFLRGEGVTDFGHYACVPGTNPPRVEWSVDVPTG